MKKRLLVFLLSVTIINCGFSQIAITEFMSNPLTSDTYNEWIELYNYSNVPVNLKNWRLTDQDIDSTTIASGDLIMQPNTYLILAIDKDSMEYNWLGGVANPQVVDYDNYFLANGSDEIVLKDSNSTVIWSLAYSDDDVNGIATFLEYNFDFSSGPSFWGNKSAPGIDRDSVDVTSTTLGYQGDSVTSDANQVISSYGDIKGSPLAGSYVPLFNASINKIGTKNKFAMYPNPTNGDYINFTEQSSGTIYNLNGKMVDTFINKKTHNIQKLSKGIYFVTTADRHTEKLIVK